MTWETIWFDVYFLYAKIIELIPRYTAIIEYAFHA